MGVTAVGQLTLGNSNFEKGQGNYLDNKQISSRQWEFEFLNVILYRFYSDQGTSETVRFLECLTRVWMTSILWVFKLLGVDWVYEFRIFSPQI